MTRWLLQRLALRVLVWLAWVAAFAGALYVLHALSRSAPPPDYGAVAPAVYHVAGVCE